MTFSLTPKPTFPRPQSDGFPQGIQWQADGTPLGDRHVQTVDLRGFGSGGVTRDQDTLTIVAPAPGSGGGGGGGATGPVALFSAIRDFPGQSSGSIAIFNGTSGLYGTFNEGGHYNTSTGIFTVPVDDYYVFRAQIEIGGLEPIPLELLYSIRVNGLDMAIGASFPDPAEGIRKVPALMTLGPIALANGAQVHVQALSRPFSFDVRMAASAASRFEAWRFGANLVLT